MKHICFVVDALLSILFPNSINSFLSCFTIIIMGNVINSCCAQEHDNTIIFTKEVVEIEDIVTSALEESDNILSENIEDTITAEHAISQIKHYVEHRIWILQQRVTRRTCIPCPVCRRGGNQLASTRLFCGSEVDEVFVFIGEV